MSAATNAPSTKGAVGVLESELLDHVVIRWAGVVVRQQPHDRRDTRTVA